MKTDLSRSQIQTLMMGLVAVLGGGVLAWLGLSALGERQIEAQALADRMNNPALASLLADPSGANRAKRDAAEIQKLAQELQQKDMFAAEWSQTTKEFAGDGEEWSKDPGKWKDRLIAIQSQLQKEAKDQKVQMAPDFYLGLDSFRQKSPGPEEVSALALHLSVAERLVRGLMTARKASEQYPTACELLALAGPGSDPTLGDKGQEKPLAASTPPSKTNARSTPIQRHTFQLEILCSPEVLYQYVRFLATDLALFIITDLSVVNEKQVFPLRSEIAKGFSESTSPAREEMSPGEVKGKRLLEILAGGENLRALIQIDFVAWNRPAPASP